MCHHSSHGRRVGFTQIELLVVVSLMGVLASMLVVGAQKAREAARRIECTNQLRQLGVASHNYHETVGLFPSEVPANGGGQGPSLYVSLLDYVELTSVRVSGDYINVGVKLYLCPSRRNSQNAPGKRDFVYVQQAAGSGYAVFETPGGADMASITTANGTAYTALLSHMWLTPTQWVNGSSNDDWYRAPNSVQSAMAVPDQDPTGSGGLGSPHHVAMPTLFGDGHVQTLPYTWMSNQANQGIWNWSNSTHIDLP